MTRKKLKNAGLDYASIDSEYVEPRNATESRLTEIWKDVLNRDKVGVKDDFFVLGGHSLKAIKMLSSLNLEFKLDIQLVEVYNRKND